MALTYLTLGKSAAPEKWKSDAMDALERCERRVTRDADTLCRVPGDAKVAGLHLVAFESCVRISKTSTSRKSKGHFSSLARRAKVFSTQNQILDAPASFVQCRTVVYLVWLKICMSLKNGGGDGESLGKFLAVATIAAAPGATPQPSRHSREGALACLEWMEIDVCWSRQTRPPGP